MATDGQARRLPAPRVAPIPLAQLPPVAETFPVPLPHRPDKNYTSIIGVRFAPESGQADRYRCAYCLQTWEKPSLIRLHVAREHPEKSKGHARNTRGREGQPVSIPLIRASDLRPVVATVEPEPEPEPELPDGEAVREEVETSLDDHVRLLMQLNESRDLARASMKEWRTRALKAERDLERIKKRLAAIVGEMVTRDGES
jgi:hypothetical protein